MTRTNGRQISVRARHKDFPFRIFVLSVASCSKSLRRGFVYFAVSRGRLRFADSVRRLERQDFNVLVGMIYPEMNGMAGKHANLNAASGKRLAARETWLCVTLMAVMRAGENR